MQQLRSSRNCCQTAIPGGVYYFGYFNVSYKSLRYSVVKEIRPFGQMIVFLFSFGLSWNIKPLLPNKIARPMQAQVQIRAVDGNSEEISRNWEDGGSIGWCVSCVGFLDSGLLFFKRGLLRRTFLTSWGVLFTNTSRTPREPWKSCTEGVLWRT